LTGRDYSQFYAEDKSNSHEYLRVLYQIATALNDLHSASVIHRDLKLDNLRSSASGILKLFDFGISVAGDNYRTKNNRGTLIYAAPELFITGAEITPEMDIYAFGICAWALATNTWPPVLRECPPQATGRAPSIASVFPGLPGEVLQLIDACLHTDPNFRPQANTLRQELARQLVRGKHRGIFAQGDATIYELSSNKQHVRITIGNLGTLKVNYDGLVFRIAEVTGDIYVNNEVAAVNMELHESCVLTFGSSASGSSRSFVPFSSSHPEVVL
jgi:serine/threonine-protein kinase